MSQTNIKLETRGRPRKNQDEKLPPISRKLFSQHCAVFYACCMVYVLQIFLKTKQEKRIGHSQGGFTIYEKMNVVYCFEGFEEDIKEWGFSQIILENQHLYDFTKTVNGCAPKFVFRELVQLIVCIHKFIQEEKINSVEDLEANQYKLLNIPQIELNKTFKYIRFTHIALKEIKMDKWNNEIAKKIKQLWRPFVKIISYTIFCTEKNIDKNKYLKPFFSDAEHPQETIIGQLNLEQIIEQKYDKYIAGSNLGFTKISKNCIQEEEPIENGVKMEYNEKSPPSQKITPASNKRPIMLITFPSNKNIDSKQSPSRIINSGLSSPEAKKSLFDFCEKDSGKQEKNEEKTPQKAFQSLILLQKPIKSKEKNQQAQVDPDIFNIINQENDEELDASQPHKKLKTDLMD